MKNLNTAIIVYFLFQVGLLISQDNITFQKQLIEGGLKSKEITLFSDNNIKSTNAYFKHKAKATFLLKGDLRKIETLDKRLISVKLAKGNRDVENVFYNALKIRDGKISFDKKLIFENTEKLKVLGGKDLIDQLIKDIEIQGWKYFNENDKIANASSVLSTEVFESVLRTTSLKTVELNLLEELGILNVRSYFNNRDLLKGNKEFSSFDFAQVDQALLLSTFIQNHSDIGKVVKALPNLDQPGNIFDLSQEEVLSKFGPIIAKDISRLKELILLPIIDRDRKPIPDLVVLPYFGGGFDPCNDPRAVGGILGQPRLKMSGNFGLYPQSSDCGFDVRDWLRDRNEGTTLELGQNEFFNGKLDDDNSISIVEVSNKNDCNRCLENNNLLSPGVYLLNLVYFLTDSLKIPSENPTFEGLEKRLYQDIKNISFSEELFNSKSYLELANEVLFKFLRNEGSSISSKNLLFNNFHDPSRFFPYPNVIEDQFDSYVNYLGTTRNEVKLASLIGLESPFAKKLAYKLGISTSDLSKLNKEIGNTANPLDFNALLAVKKIVKEKIRKESKDVVLQNYNGEQFYVVKNKLYENYFEKRNQKIQEYLQTIFSDTLNSLIDINTDSLDILIQELKNQITICLDYEDSFCELSEPIPSYYMLEEFLNLYNIYFSSINSQDDIQVEINLIIDSLSNSKANEIVIDRFKIALDTISGNNWKEQLENVIRKDYFTLLEDLNIIKSKLENISKEIELYVVETIQSEVFIDKWIGKIVLGLSQNEINKNSNSEYIFNEYVDALTQKRWDEVESKLEQDFHRQVRENLLEIILEDELIKNSPLLNGVVDRDRKIELLSEYLFIDFRQEVNTTDTEISFALERLQLFIELGLDDKAYKTGLQKNRYNFRRIDRNIWQWMDTYDTWHAAMSVYYYPENFLDPDLRGNRSWHFDHYIENLSIENISNVEDRIEETYVKKVRELSDLEPFHLQEFRGRLFVLANTKQGEIYFSYLNGNRWTLWQPVENSTLNTDKKINVEMDCVWDSNANQLFISTAIVKKEVGKNDKINTFYNQINFEESDGRYKLKIGNWQNNEIEYFNKAGIGKSSPHFSFQFFKDGIQQIGVISRQNSDNGVVINPEEEARITYASQSGVQEKSIWFENVIDIVNHPDDRGKLYWIKEKGSSSYMYKLDAMKNDSLNIKYDDSQRSDSTKVSVDGIDNTRGYDVFIINNIEYVLNRRANVLFKLNGDKINNGKYVSLRSVEEYNGEYWCLGKDLEKIYVARGISISSNNKLSGGEKQYLTRSKSEIVEINARNNNNQPIGNHPANLYLEEIGLHIPKKISKEYSDAGNEPEARKWLAYIYASLGNIDVDLVPANINREYSLIPDNPFDAYSIAASNPDLHTVANKYAYLESLLVEADQLFIQDTPESVNLARELYQKVLYNLGVNQTKYDTCALYSFDPFLTDDSINSSFGSIPSLRGSDLGYSFDKQIKELKNSPLNKKVAEFLQNLNLSDLSPRIRVLGKDLIPFIQSKGDAGFTINDAKVLNEAEKNKPLIITNLERLGQIIVNSSYDGNDFVRKNFLLSSYNEKKSNLNLQVSRFGNLVKTPFSIQYISPTAFCLPQNPKRLLFIQKAQSNIDKIRNGLNYSGLKRELPLYSRPISATAIFNAGGIKKYKEQVNNTKSNFPPIYRYDYLYERAKSLTNTAQQFEKSILNSKEKLDNAKYSLFKARQDLQLEKANISLQSLRLRDVAEEIQRAQFQEFRANQQFNHYDQLVKGGISYYEKVALDFQWASFSAQSAALAARLIWPIDLDPENVIGGFLSDKFDRASGLFQTSSSIYNTKASFQRREQEWKFSRSLARTDQQLAKLGVKQSINRQKIAERELAIANLRYQLSNDVLQYKIRQNEEGLYSWMKETYEDLYREQLYLAASTAKAAQQALEFERQTNYDFIGYDYSQFQRDGVFLGAERLLLDIEKLQQEKLTSTVRKQEVVRNISIANLAPETFQEFKRTGRLEFETLKSLFDRDFPGHYMRTIKSVQINLIGLVAPNEGIKATLSNNGISQIMTGSPFEEATAIYKLPESITLSTGRNDRGLIELTPDNKLLNPFEGIGVATKWLFEMDKGANPIDYKNIFDIVLTINYTALFDGTYKKKVLKKLGLNDFGEVRGESKRYFSLRNEFPSQWYSFINPIFLNDSTRYFDPMKNAILSKEAEFITPYTILVKLTKDDFIPNEQSRRIKRISLAVQIAKEEEGVPKYERIELPLKMKFFPRNKTALLIKPGLSNSSLESSIEYFNVNDIYDDSYAFNGQSPYGTWCIQLDTSNLKDPLINIDLGPNGKLERKIDLKVIQDILLIVDYEAKVKYNTY